MSVYSLSMLYFLAIFRCFSPVAESTVNRSTVRLCILLLVNLLLVVSFRSVVLTVGEAFQAISSAQRHPAMISGNVFVLLCVVYYIRASQWDLICTSVHPAKYCTFESTKRNWKKPNFYCNQNRTLKISRVCLCYLHCYTFQHFHAIISLQPMAC